MNIIELAEQAGIEYSDLMEAWVAYGYHIERFAELVRQDEREAIEREQAGALPPTDNAIYWMDMVVGNLVRNGVNKHRARELANHFYTYTTPHQRRTTMAKDNSTGKDKEFYELGKRLFDSIPSTVPRPSKIETKLQSDIDLLWRVNSADIEALEDAKATLEILKKSAPLEFDDMIDESLVLIKKALAMNHGDSIERVTKAAIRGRTE